MALLTESNAVLAILMSLLKEVKKYDERKRGFWKHTINYIRFKTGHFCTEHQLYSQYVKKFFNIECRKVRFMNYYLK